MEEEEVKETPMRRDAAVSPAPATGDPPPIRLLDAGPRDVAGDVNATIQDGASTGDATPMMPDAGGLPPPRSAGCQSTLPVPDGLQTFMLGTTRQSYYVHAPRGYVRTQAHPLMFMFHGSTHSGRDYEGTGPTSGLFGEGIRYHVGGEAILVFPNATAKTG
jgi:hypothetical protein